MKKWAPLLFQSAVSLRVARVDFGRRIFGADLQVLNSAHLGWLVAGFPVAGADLIGVLRWAIFRVLGISLAPGRSSMSCGIVL
jgi:hypothetical protein